jgi:ABC-2 type transport system permease protein
VIEDRREGFMQSVLVAPVSRLGVVMGKVMGGATLALGESLVFLLFWVGLDIPFSAMALLLTVGYLFLLGVGLTAIGFAIAWRMSSTAGYHAVMNLFLLPMWVLSGAFFPPSGASTWLGLMIMVNPLTYGMAGLRQALYSAQPMVGTHLPDPMVCLGITVIFVVVAVGIAVWQVLRPGKV